jgi:transport and Golgi organization protein 2
MCTLSVITHEDGYLLGMNRDERIARGAGLPPECRDCGGTRAIYPTDGADGTWIAANESGVALALLNWNDVVPRHESQKDRRSRGLLIPALIGSHSLVELQSAMAKMALEGILPFRLVGVSRLEKEICEWRWDSVTTEFLWHEWQARHWFSSSLSDRKAKDIRGGECSRAWSEFDAGSAPWLRRLHASHGNGPWPFSLCVHRSDVRTLSYTQIECTRAAARMKHFLSSPCSTSSDDVGYEVGLQP